MVAVAQDLVTVKDDARRYRQVNRSLEVITEDLTELKDATLAQLGTAGKVVIKTALPIVEGAGSKDLIANRVAF